MTTEKKILINWSNADLKDLKLEVTSFKHKNEDLTLKKKAYEDEIWRHREEYERILR